MKNEIESIKNTLDQLLIETALNTAHLQTLTLGYFELADHALSKVELSNLKSHYYGTLYEKSAQLLNSPDYLHKPAKGTMALFDLHCFVQEHLKDLS
ncbi:hypothetical protein [Flavobacterium psychrophilum]|uniref:hypothetical protein n=1 Tax=Flavobacterium psychrophilum TaxID=96345 RepID=UPI000B7C4056|nr:hypothetical protein [Flavobacterium psychrophilum]EKT4520531.1 hypothetical protein [Flavobacterium psychrophilum]EKT4551998.1 hypothetical protein [Flavobacterium psychrophilum]MBF2024340.1 hypothetical protein [Flavobacterium psychrophilum]MCB5983208.1 hypothetical protein [Flavobacterium psychrophilum]MCB5995454.1 hypothetical protein [Flavobacterium psychrophilum]